MNIQILYEDNFLMVINKPAGTVVNRVETEKGETIQDWLENNFQFSIFNFQNFRFGIVHRLDKETSGCLIIAKTEEAFVDLQRQFRERVVKKEYVALVHGRVEPKEGTIKVPIARSHHDRDKFAVVVGGRVSETGYEVVSQFAIGNSCPTSHGRPARPDFVCSKSGGSPGGRAQLSLLKVYPKTGRTHQIRVHFKYFGHPLVSDEKYAGNIALEDRKWCPRIFLHAEKIEFYHPLNKNKVTVEAGLPEDLTQALSFRACLPASGGTRNLFK